MKEKFDVFMTDFMDQTGIDEHFPFDFYQLFDHSVIKLSIRCPRCNYILGDCSLMGDYPRYGFSGPKQLFLWS